MNVNRQYICVLFIITAVLISSSLAKKSASKNFCPKDGETSCVECVCDDKTGFSSCGPTDCPPDVNKVSDANPNKPEGECRFGKKFNAECSLCDCTGKRDHCAVCAALPVKRPTQTIEVNNKLPWINDARFFQYEITGWSTQKQWLTD